MKILLEYIDKLKEFAKENNVAILTSNSKLGEVEKVSNIREIIIGTSENLIQQSNHVLSIAKVRQDESN